jgi:two-component system OmpR family response regulator
MLNILLVEDDIDLAQHLVRGLREQDFAVEHAIDGEAGLVLASSGAFHVIVLDRMLPLLDGLSLVRQLRAKAVLTPAIFLTTLGGIDDRVQGLNAGGDDYLVKPFAFAEFLARVRVLGRRPVGSDALTQLRAGPLHMNLLERTAARDGKLVELLPQEFRLLEYHGA